MVIMGFASSSHERHLRVVASFLTATGFPLPGRAQLCPTVVINLSQIPAST